MVHFFAFDECDGWLVGWRKRSNTYPYDAGRHTTLMEYPAINALAEKFKATPAQILLSWGVQRGTSVIPKSENAERMAKNLQVRRTSLQRNCTLWVLSTDAC